MAHKLEALVLAQEKVVNRVTVSNPQTRPSEVILDFRTEPISFPTIIQPEDTNSP